VEKREKKQGGKDPQKKGRIGRYGKGGRWGVRMSGYAGG
jgi:hypothetical protein